jgi:hypothetical protein
MAFEVELTNNSTGEDVAIVVETKDLDTAINLTHTEYPDYTLTFIAEAI